MAGTCCKQIQAAAAQCRGTQRGLNAAPSLPLPKWGQLRRGATQRPLAFMGALDSMPSLISGWLIPSGPAPEPNSPSPSPRDCVRHQRLRQLRGMLEAARQQPPLPLPPSPADEASGTNATADEGSSSSISSGSTVESSLIASNAVPFHTSAGTGGAGLPATLSGPSSSGASGAACRAEEARQVLPWLYCVEGRLDFSAMEALASQLALSGLLLLDVSRYVAASTSSSGHWHKGWGGHIRWAGRQGMPSPVVAAAAALRRMELRRGGALTQLPEMEGKVVVLAFNPQHRQLAAETLALYLHAYGGLCGQEAVQAAGHAVGTSPLESTLCQSVEELAVIADGWYRRVTLAWPYGGGHVEIVGEAVGGWDIRAPMVFDVKRKNWHLQIWGLRPGIHRFKYLVDGCWVIDLAADKEGDGGGNTNNVVMVSNSGRPLLRSQTASISSSMDDQETVAGAENAGMSTVATVAGDDMQAADAAAAAAAGVLATAEPAAVAAAAGGEEAVDKMETSKAEVPPSQPWSSPEEMEAMARFGAAVMAFHTRLDLQLRHALH